MRLLSVLIALAIALTTSFATADEAADAFNEGKRLFGKNEFDKSCDAFKRSEQLGGKNVKTQYWLGRCNEERGHRAAAYEAFLEAQRLAEKAGDTERAEVAKKRVGELEKELPFLVVTVPKEVRVKGLTIHNDGEAVPPERWEKPFAVEAGKHSIVVRAPGMQDMTLSFTATDPGSKAQLVIPALSPGEGSTAPDAPIAKPEPAKPGPVPVPALPDEPEMKRKSAGLFWTGVGLVCAGGIAVIAGGILAVLSASDTDAAAEDRTPGTITAFVAGGVFLAVGIPFMAVFGKKVPVEPEPAATGFTIEPILTPGGLVLRGTF